MSLLYNTYTLRYLMNPNLMNNEVTTGPLTATIMLMWPVMKLCLPPLPQSLSPRLLSSCLSPAHRRCERRREEGNRGERRGSEERGGEPRREEARREEGKQQAVREMRKAELYHVFYPQTVYIKVLPLQKRLDCNGHQRGVFSCIDYNYNTTNNENKIIINLVSLIR